MKYLLMCSTALAMAGLLAVLGCGDDADDDTAMPDDDVADDDVSDDDSAGDDDSADDDDDSAPGTEAGWIDVQIPSDAAPTDGIAVRIHHPGSEAIRYPRGAPVVVRIEGGWNAGELKPEASDPNVEQFGFIDISYLLPGGTSEDGAASGGEYDFRGADCLTATRDVLKFAAGLITDNDGRTLRDRLPFAWNENLGIIAGSNGGNLALATLAEESANLPPIAWFVAWESPIGDQYQACELNGNDFYEPGTCGTTSCPWDGMEAQLRYDAAGQTVFNDWDGVQQTLDGVVYLDADASDAFEPGELAFGFVPGPRDGADPALVFSQELADLIDADPGAVFGASDPPAWLADQAATETFWQLRDGSLRLAEAHAAFPDLMVIHINTQEDHAQTQPDFPHARSHVQGWIDASHAFVRLNPDAVYMEYVSGQDASFFPDNDANEPVAWPDTVDLMIPTEVEGQPASSWTEPAAVLELAERYWRENLEVNLDDLLVNPR